MVTAAASQPLIAGLFGRAGHGRRGRMAPIIRLAGSLGILNTVALGIIHPGNDVFGHDGLLPYGYVRARRVPATASARSTGSIPHQLYVPVPFLGAYVVVQFIEPLRRSAASVPPPHRPSGYEATTGNQRAWPWMRGLMVKGKLGCGRAVR